MTSSCNHVVPGEHIYDGVMYAGIFPDRSLEKIKSFEFRDEDVILATYPKSGEYWPLSLHWLLVVSPIPSARIENFRSIIWLVHDDVIKWKYFRVTGPLCGEFNGPGEFPAQRPVTRSFDVFFDLRLNKRLSKQPWGWWFETLAWSLWRHRNVIALPFVLLVSAIIHVTERIYIKSAFITTYLCR